MSTSTDSSREYQDLVTQSTPQPYGAPPRRRRNLTNTSGSKSNRFYSSPLNDSPDSTPLQVYGLERREPSISDKPRNRHLQRVSYALDDIKEDFSSGQLSPRTTADRIKRRTSVFISDGPPSSPSSSPRPSTPMTSEGQRSRPMSILSLDALSSPPQRLGRRLSSLSSFSRRKGAKQEASISQPNLIGSSTQL